MKPAVLGKDELQLFQLFIIVTVYLPLNAMQVCVHLIHLAFMNRDDDLNPWCILSFWVFAFTLFS